MRFARALLFGVALAFVGLPATEIAAPNEARAESVEIGVGTELEAIADITLSKAEIAKGSKVSVAKLMEHGGRIEGALLELADGHVISVAIGTVRSLFSVVHE